MISDNEIIRRIDFLTEKRKELVNKKITVMASLSNLKLSKQAVYKASRDKSLANYIGIDKLKLRDTLSDEFQKIEKEIVEINTEINNVHLKNKEVKNTAIVSILREIFSEQQMDEIKKEAKRRLKGEGAIPLGLDFKELQRYKDGYHKYRQLSREQIDKMIDFRASLTFIIERGCKEFGDAEFLRFISPLNKLIMPLKELQKLKLQMFG